VPPKGMHRVRAFGLLHRDHRNTLRRLQLLLAPRPASAPLPERSPRPRNRCRHCRDGDLHLVLPLSPRQCWLLCLLPLLPLLLAPHRPRPPPPLRQAEPRGVGA
jgi:hypothetical protein